jgi:NAD(P)H-dependent FMN reductase
MTAPRSILFLLASSRTAGNTELLARAAAESVPTAMQKWIRLSDHPLPPFEDHRHDGIGYGAPGGSARLLLDATLEATELVVAAPTYWYSLPASAKLYLDHWSHWMRVPDLRFKERMLGKTLWAITVCSNDPGDDSGTQPLVETLRNSAEYMKMRWGGALIGHANQPGTVREDAAAISRARTFLDPKE